MKPRQTILLGLKKLKRLVWADQPPIGVEYPVVQMRQLRADPAYGPDRDYVQLSRSFAAFEGASKRTSKWAHYFRIYDECLLPLRESLRSSRVTPGVIEIGTAYGGSLVAWKEFFGEDAYVSGIDVEPRETEFADPRIRVFSGSQTDHDTLRRAIEFLPQLSLVVDDGSHLGRDQKSTFRYLWPRLAVGGLYLVEDLHTAYWRHYEGGIFRRRKSGFVDYAKTLVDAQHSSYSSRRRGQFEKEHVSNSLFSTTFFDSIVVLKKVALSESRFRVSNSPS